MMKSTSSSSADGTTEGSRQDQTGRQSIEKSNANGSAVSDFMARHMAEHARLKRMNGWDYRWWLMKAHVRHWAGVHTLVLNEVWEHEGNEVKIRKNGMICWLCPYREP